MCVCVCVTDGERGGNGGSNRLRLICQTCTARCQEARGSNGDMPCKDAHICPTEHVAWERAMRWTGERQPLSEDRDGKEKDGERGQSVIDTSL